MKKLLLALPIFIGVAGGSWAGSTIYSGSESRDAYDRVIADLNDSLGLALVNSEYLTGFLKSEATTEVRLTDEPGADVLFRLRHVIAHSPVGTGASPSLSAARIITTVITEDFENDLAAKVLKGFGDEQPMTLLSRVGFDGTVDSEFTIAPFEFDDGSGKEIHSEAVVWNTVIDSEGAQAGSGHWSGAVIKTPVAIVSVSEMNTTFDFTRTSDGLYQGSGQHNVAKVQLNVPHIGLSTGIRDVTMGFLSDITNDRLSGNLSLAINDIDAPIPLDSVQVKTRFGGLGIEGIKQLNTMYLQLLAADFSDDSAAEKQIIKRYANAIGALIKPGAYYGYDLSLGNEGGTADASITATFKGDDSPSGHDLLTSPNAIKADLLRAVKIEASMNAPDDALALTPAAMFVDPAMLAPWIIADGTSLKSNILINNLTISFNGDSMSLETMLGDELYAPLSLDEFMSI